MAQDLFRDSTMTFGEHIEELRTHLIRAITGLLVAFIVCIGFGDRVVKIIAGPVRKELKVAKERGRTKRSEEYQAKQSELRQAERDNYVTIRAKLPVETIQKLAQAIAPGSDPASIQEPITIDLQAPVAGFIEELSEPLAEVGGMDRPMVTSAHEGFMIFIKSALGAALVLASPWLFYQIYSFIAVGLYAHERRFVNLTLPFSVALFLIGVSVCYFMIFPFMLKFFLTWPDNLDLEPQIRISEWVGFSVLLMLIFGIMFQLPLLMLMLERVGIVSHDQLAGKRKYAIVGMFILAAVATPADPISQVMLALPMCLLFELGLFLMRYFQRRNPFAVAEPQRD